MKRFVRVEPVVSINAEKTHSHYSYPDSFITGNLKAAPVAYNHQLPDFLAEQLWLLDGSDSEIREFCKALGVTPVESWDEAGRLAAQWNPPIALTINNGAAVIEAIQALNLPELPPALDPKNSAPGIAEITFKLSDHISKQEFNEANNEKC